MEDNRIREEIVTQFFLKTCHACRRMNTDDLTAWAFCAVCGENSIPLTTGSVAEFYIEPILSCVGDIDIMIHVSNELAIPAGYPPPTQLPGEFDSRVKVYEIVDSEFPGYVYLVSSYVLTECVDDGKYNAVPCERLLGFDNVFRDTSIRSGLAHVLKRSDRSFSLVPYMHRVRVSSTDVVGCMRCLVWPPQAADWPTRHRNHGWPDPATIDRVVGNGCDMVQVAHRSCRQDEWISKCQWRLSF